MNSDINLLEESAKLVDGLTDTMKYARHLESENAALKDSLEALKAAAAAKRPEPAIIQKVASVEDSQLEDTLNFLVERELLAPDDVEKLASSIREDPNVALRLAGQIAAITLQPVVPDRGRGISKSAGVSGDKSPEGGFGSASGWLVA